MQLLLKIFDSRLHKAFGMKTCYRFLTYELKDTFNLRDILL
jgi:hypothetical protein